MSEEKKKLSWREIDKLKDSSGFSKLRRKRERQETYFSIPEEKRDKEKYLKELEKLFSKKEDKEKEVLLKKIHNAIGKKDFQKFLLEFYEKYGLPEEGRDLLVFLDTHNKEILEKILEKIKENFKSFSWTEKQGLLAKLRALRLSLKEDLLILRLERLLQEIT